ncbi:hypothetical protein ACIQVU_02325 [Lysinibacillus sp. NPDC098008]|uniref:hypothetical protein n=1 Tax=Lysinibacillus sp. NPDC098008 TaxID=3364146 RepID=UPI0037FE132F
MNVAIHDMYEELTVCAKNKLSTGLTNFDSGLQGGFSPELYIFVGRLYDERYALFTHLIEQFAREGYQILYYSFYESIQSIQNKFLMRHDYKFHRDATSTIPSIVHQLESSPHQLALFQQYVNKIFHNLHVENTPFVKTTNLKETLSAIAKEDKVVVLLDERQLRPLELMDYEYCRSHLNELKEIAHSFNVPILSNVMLSKEDHFALQEGFLTEVGIENVVDNFIIFEQTPVLLTPYTVNLTVMSKSMAQSKPVPLTYHSSHYYFQDA